LLRIKKFFLVSTSKAKEDKDHNKLDEHKTSTISIREAQLLISRPSDIRIKAGRSSQKFIKIVKSRK